MLKLLLIFFIIIILIPNNDSSAVFRPEIDLAPQIKEY